MSDAVIRVQNLGKRYRLGQLEPYKTLRDALVRAATAPFRAVPSALRNRQARHSRNPREDSYVWALRNVSFEVREGEVVGIIGPNGAGKTTLLKVLSRITEPTEGKAEIRGRVGSLLEVGTGFHPELTGRENVYFNGAVLGMRQQEIDRKFDDIVAFAELERFMGTPVKRYSSGMYVRLAFAVAAHLEPEILVVDEVLAVGDIAFQKKCLGKMGAVAEEGRTVLFVSHNMGAIRSLCSSAIVMQNGHSGQKGGVDIAIMEYVASQEDASQTSFPIRIDEVVLHSFDVAQDGHTASEYDGGRPIDISIKYELTRDLTLFRIGFFLTTSTGDLILRSLLADWQPEREKMAKGKYEIHCRIPPHYVAAGNYALEVHSSRYGIKDYGFNALTRRRITVAPSSSYNLAHVGERPFGLVLLEPRWSLKMLQSI